MIGDDGGKNGDVPLSAFLFATNAEISLVIVAWWSLRQAWWAVGNGEVLPASWKLPRNPWHVHPQGPADGGLRELQ